MHSAKAPHPVQCVMTGRADGSRLRSLRQRAIGPPAQFDWVTPVESGRQYRGLVGKLLLGVLLFLAVDFAAFGGGFYFRWIDPQSSLGGVARAIDNAAHASSDRPNVLVLGDSRIAEGFSAKTANAVATPEGRSATFINSAIPGTTPRAWYYLLRRILPSFPRPAAAVIMTTSYHDNDAFSSDTRLTDIVFTHPLLHLGDLATFPASFPSASDRLSAAEAILLSGYYYKNDLMDFIAHPSERIRTVRSWRAHGFDWINDYPGRDASLAGMQFDPRTGELSLPPSVRPPPASRLDDYAAALHQSGGRPPDDPSSVAYRKLWYGKIAALCEAEGVALFMLRIPRGPLHFMVDPDGDATGALAALRDDGRLQLLPATLFDGLERPEFFFDQLHMNAAGRARFSTVLATTMLQRLAGSE